MLIWVKRSNLGLQCLPMSLNRVARLILVKRSLIWVCTVCLCPKIEALCLYGLTESDLGLHFCLCPKIETLCSYMYMG